MIVELTCVYKAKYLESSLQCPCPYIPYGFLVLWLNHPFEYEPPWGRKSHNRMALLLTRERPPGDGGDYPQS